MPLMARIFELGERLVYLRNVGSLDALDRKKKRALQRKRDKERKLKAEATNSTQSDDDDDDKDVKGARPNRQPGPVYPVYATKVFHTRKFDSLKRNRARQRKRLLKLKAIYMMMVGQDLNAVMNRPNDANAANAAAADDWPNEDVGQNANDDDVLILEDDHQMIPAPAVSPSDPVPNRQQLPWDDNYLQTLMEAYPQLYGYVIFSHLYQQLWDCTD
ncbi:hypothetical protein TYRP_023652 [Tyrophagus putrescentiae]|nr:hypothetical protein TYRP_023652 [Tyrophagus putrescentiae]